MTKAFFYLIPIFILSACASPRVGNMGLLYTDTETGLAVTQNLAGTRVGEACLQSYLGLISTGDASIETARRTGGITSITSVDEKSTGILGFIYRKYCTVVRGR